MSQRLSVPGRTPRSHPYETGRLLILAARTGQRPGLESRHGPRRTRSGTPFMKSGLPSPHSLSARPACSAPHKVLTPRAQWEPSFARIPVARSPRVLRRAGPVGVGGTVCSPTELASRAHRGGPAGWHALPAHGCYRGVAANVFVICTIHSIYSIAHYDMGALEFLDADRVSCQTSFGIRCVAARRAACRTLISCR